MLIWHVDEGQSSNADENHKRVDLEEADGLAHLDSETNSGDAGDPFPGTSAKTTFNDASNPNTKNYSGAATLAAVTGISASSATMTANFTALPGGVADHVRYDENDVEFVFGFGNTVAWAGINALNDTAYANLDGVDVYVTDSTGATIDIYFYASMAGGTPTGLIHSQSGFAAGPGWNRLLLTTPQPFPQGAERGVVIKVTNNSFLWPGAYDASGAVSGRSYYSSDGSGSFSPMCPVRCGDLNLVALISGVDTTPPTADAIIPSTTGPTNASSVTFDVTFSEDVVNFNDAFDVNVYTGGVFYSGVDVYGFGSSYTINVQGLMGNDSFVVEVNTASDVADLSGNPLASSVISDPVYIDNFRPDAHTITPATTGPTSADSVNFTIDFSEDVVNFNDASDVTINHSGTAHGSVDITGSGSSYNANVQGITGDGSFTLKVNSASDVQDEAGNLFNNSVTSASVSIDNTAPAAQTITPATTGPTNADSISFDITFSESVQNFDGSSDVTIVHSGTTHGGVSISGSGASFSANVTGISGDGSFTLQVNTGSDVHDTAGNSLTSSVTSAAVNIDTTAPTISIGAPSEADTSSGPVSYIITYSGADSVSLENSDVTLNATGSATGSVAVGGAGTSSRTVTISNIFGSGTLGISIAAETAADTAGNTAAAAGPSASFSVAPVELIFEHSFEDP